MSVPKTSRSVALAERSFDWLTPGAVVMALGHFLSAMSPSVWTWGIDYWSVLPLWGQCLLLLLVAIAVLPGFPRAHRSVS